MTEKVATWQEAVDMKELNTAVNEALDAMSYDHSSSLEEWDEDAKEGLKSLCSNGPLYTDQLNTMIRIMKPFNPALEPDGELGDEFMAVVDLLNSQLESDEEDNKEAAEDSKTG